MASSPFATITAMRTDPSVDLSAHVSSPSAAAAAATAAPMPSQAPVRLIMQFDERIYPFHHAAERGHLELLAHFLSTKITVMSTGTAVPIPETTAHDTEPCADRAAAIVASSINSLRACLKSF